jgi:hypothetical protein
MYDSYIGKRNAWLYTLIPPLSTWTNNIVKKIGSHYTLSTISHIIGPRR